MFFVKQIFEVINSNQIFSEKFTKEILWFSIWLLRVLNECLFSLLKTLFILKIQKIPARYL